MQITTAVIQGDLRSATINNDGLERIVAKDSKDKVLGSVRLAQRIAALDEQLIDLAANLQKHCDGFIGCGGDVRPYLSLIYQVAGV